MRSAQSDNLTGAEAFKAPFGNRLVAERDISLPRVDRQNKPHIAEVHVDAPASHSDDWLRLKKRWNNPHATPSLCSPEQLETVFGKMNAGNTDLLLTAVNPAGFRPTDSGDRTNMGFSSGAPPFALSGGASPHSASPHPVPANDDEPDPWPQEQAA